MRLQRVVVVVVDVGFGFFLPSLFPLLLRRLAVFFPYSSGLEDLLGCSRWSI